MIRMRWSAAGLGRKQMAACTLADVSTGPKGAIVELMCASQARAVRQTLSTR